MDEVDEVEDYYATHLAQYSGPDTVSRLPTTDPEEPPQTIKDKAKMYGREEYFVSVELSTFKEHGGLVSNFRPKMTLAYHKIKVLKDLSPKNNLRVCYANMSSETV